MQDYPFKKQQFKDWKKIKARISEDLSDEKSLIPADHKHCTLAHRNKIQWIFTA